MEDQVGGYWVDGIYFSHSDTDITEQVVDISWAGEYKSTNQSFSCKNKPKGSPKSFIKIPKTEISNLSEFCKGFVRGALYQAGLNLNDVVFCPADTILHSNTQGKPVYVFDRGDYYEIETWFTKL